MQSPLRAQAGFTYFGVLFLVFATGLALASFAAVHSLERRRDKEAELLFAGHQFREAIRLYYAAVPGGLGRYPPNLEALLQDPRTPGIRRHLRRIYPDPITGKAEWGVVEAPGGGVMGVFSLSTDVPVKTANFDAADEDFTGARAYSDWKFVYIPSKEGEYPLSRIGPQGSVKN